MIAPEVMEFMTERGFVYDVFSEFSRLIPERGHAQGFMSSSDGMWYAEIRRHGFIARGRSLLALYAFVEMHDWALARWADYDKAPLVGGE